MDSSTTKCHIGIDACKLSSAKYLRIDSSQCFFFLLFKQLHLHDIVFFQLYCGLIGMSNIEMEGRFSFSLITSRVFKI